MQRQGPKVIGPDDRDDIARTRALKRIYAENADALRAFLRVRMTALDEVEDVVQDTWMRLARIHDLEAKFSSTCGDARGYIFSIAANLLVDRARRNAVRQLYARAWRAERVEYTAPAPEASLATRQELERAKEIIMGLSPKCRRAFILSRFRYLSYQQIAEVMGVPRKRIEKYISQALKAIRDQVSPP
jgi:RNA polymerase sigma factor (sigma-70 family)